MCSPIQVFFDRWQVLFPRGDGKQTGFRKIHRMVHRYTIRFVGDLLLLSDEQLTIMKNIGAETLKKMSIVLSDFSLCRGPSRTLEAFATWRGLLTASENH